VRQQSAATQAAEAAPAKAAGRVLQRKCACGKNTAGGGECGACGYKRAQGIQRKAADRSPFDGAIPPVVGDVLGSQGRPLDAPTRTLMESRLGHDFSGVRVHTGALAAESAHAVNALAYTVGRDVVFGDSRYAPTTGAGQRLLAHELTHVAQQRAGVGASASEGHYEREADAAASAFGRGARPSGLTAAGARLQRFEESEHRSLGNEASGNATVNIGGTAPGTELFLPFGDVVMLSGDWFDPDELSRLAAKPGKNGWALGTRDEVLCALRIINPQDPRFKAGGVWAGFDCQHDVETAVNGRFNILAGANTPHFAAPRGRDASGQPNPVPAGEVSAGMKYRSVHESAIRMAYQAGHNQGTTAQAMGREAAAQHFLSDSFSAGHVRTPAGAIRQHWAGVYPLFWYNLQHKIALDTATEINSSETNASTIFGTVQMIYESIIEEVEKLAKNLPALTFGDVIVIVLHDYDNVSGVDIGGGQKIYGDDHLDNPDPQNVTRRIAVESMSAGIKDIEEAFTLGKAGGDLKDAALFDAVRAATNAPAGAYVAETKLPHPAPSVPQQNWKAADIQTIWNTHAVGTSGPTIGELITKSLRDPSATMHKKVAGLATQFDEIKKGVHPRRAYLAGFVKPIIDNPFKGLMGVIDWAPNYGLRSVDRDDISVATGEQLYKQGKLGGMTTPARVKYIRELIDGTVFGDEEDLVIHIFETAPAAERPRIYQLVEGHKWTGDWIEGITVPDDDIWNALSRSRLRRLQRIINEGWRMP
jgi:hypothetical protein